MFSFGLFFGMVGLLTTLSSLNEYASGCIGAVRPYVGSATMEKHYGPAFICLLLATLLKVVDLFAHVLVPVPEKGYWVPSGAGCGKGIAGSTSTSGGSTSRAGKQESASGIEMAELMAPDIETETDTDLTEVSDA